MGNHRNGIIYGKNDHVRIIKAIAEGMAEGNLLNNYLELGIRRGPCFNAVAPMVKGKAYGVDINADCYKNIKQNKNLVWFCGKSHEFLEQHDKNEKFDLVFIDADHSHEASLRDFEMVIPFLHEDSIVCLHDTYPYEERFLTKSYCFDTWKTAKVIKERYLDEFEIVTLPFYFGISVVRVCNNDRQLGTWYK